MNNCRVIQETNAYLDSLDKEPLEQPISLHDMGHNNLALDEHLEANGMDREQAMAGAMALITKMYGGK